MIICCYSWPPLISGVSPGLLSNHHNIKVSKGKPHPFLKCREQCLLILTQDLSSKWQPSVVLVARVHPWLTWCFFMWSTTARIKELLPAPRWRRKCSIVKPGPVLILRTACWREKTDLFDLHGIPSPQHTFTWFNKNVIKIEKTAASFGIVKDQKPSALETNTILSYLMAQQCRSIV